MSSESYHPHVQALDFEISEPQIIPIASLVRRAHPYRPVVTFAALDLVRGLEPMRLWDWLKWNRLLFLHRLSPSWIQINQPLSRVFLRRMRGPLLYAWIIVEDKTSPARKRGRNNCLRSIGHHLLSKRLII